MMPTLVQLKCFNSAWICGASLLIGGIVRANVGKIVFSDNSSFMHIYVEQKDKINVKSLSKSNGKTLNSWHSFVVYFLLWALENSKANFISESFWLFGVPVTCMTCFYRLRDGISPSRIRINVLTTVRNGVQIWAWSLQRKELILRTIRSPRSAACTAKFFKQRKLLRKML